MTAHLTFHLPEPAEFRAALSHYPTGVAVVTSYLPGAGTVGMVVGTFTSASLDPVLVGWPATRVLQIGRPPWQKPSENGLLNDYGDDER